jgi:hypothetical protein
MTVASEFEVANKQYEAGFDKADLPMPPGRYASHIRSQRFIIIAFVPHSYRWLIFTNKIQKSLCPDLHGRSS